MLELPVSLSNSNYYLLLSEQRQFSENGAIYNPNALFIQCQVLHYRGQIESQ